ncbi:DoxX family protein [Acinetobacter dispersus]|uniref:DoxX family protein n=1 Tax=Acinetobacter dispersus TaxID=70348 RepID=UPI0021CDDE2F|nr:DoxX family protein [Acinetobacter dispersus]MCU4335871.1 DoxX family protein [Acinetobacter dispersus]
MLKLIYDNPLYKMPIQQFVLFLIRISIGIFFFTTGFNKLFVEKNKLIMLETIIDAGIPYPAIMSTFVSATEMLAGLFLILGLLTQISSIFLFMICLTALYTVGIHTIPSGLDPISWLSWFFYVHDLLYIFILAILITSQPSILSLDRILSKNITTF